MNTKQSAVLASALAAGVSQGAVIYSGPLNLQQNYDSVGTNYRQPIDMNGDGVSDFTFGYDANNLKPYVDTRTAVSTEIPVQSGIVSLFEKSDSLKGFPVTPAGTMIDASYAALYPVFDARGYMYQNDGQTVAGDWSNTAVTDAYVGIEIALAGGTSFGWLHFIDNPTANPVSLTLVDWAYESTPGVGIQTGMVVPEPSIGALAGLGMAALLMLRKHKRSV